MEAHCRRRKPILARRYISNELRALRGNIPILLDGQNAWIVESGDIALFAVRLVEGVPEGSRRLLMRVGIGDVVLAPLSSRQLDFGIIAVAVNEASFRAASTSDIVIAASQGDTVSVGRVEDWVRKVGLDPNNPFSVSQFRNSDALMQELIQLEARWFSILEADERQRQENERERLESRRTLKHKVAARTVDELASILKSTEDVSVPTEGSLLLRAVRVVGEAQGIAIRSTTDLHKRLDPLQSILQASGVRSRAVMLQWKWWTAEVGPLLAFTSDARQPVALLPRKPSLLARNRYEVFNPSDNTRRVVDNTVLANLEPTAFALYPPLADKVNSLEIIRFAMKGRAKDLGSILLTGIAATLLGMLTPQAMAILVDQAIPDANRGLVIQVSMGLLAAGAGSLLFELAQAASILRIEIGSSSILQCGVWDRLLKLNPAFFRKYSTGDLASRASAISSIRQHLSGATLRTIFIGVTSLLNLGLMFYYSPSLALAALLLALVVMSLTFSVGASVSKLTRTLQEIEGHAFGLMVQLLHGVGKLRVAAAEERAFAYWGRSYSQQQRLKQAIQKLQDRVQLFNIILPTLSTALIFWIVEETLLNGGANPAAFGLGTFLAFNAAFGTFFAGATNLSNTAIGLLDVSNLWKRARVIMDATPEVDATKAHPGRLSGRVTIEHVTFRYRDDGPLTLEDVTLEVGPGECVALVGPSGSGKSTILNLLLRFDIPLSGGVYYDGQDLSSLDVNAVRRQLGVVMQDNNIMSGSIFDNIACGAQCSLDDAWRAARAAAFDIDIEKMPMKMHTLISEGGGNISGGQRQRLLIARALVNEPKILIFDEATSALDNRTQAIVTDSLRQLKVTTILVAHRLSTIRHADRIYVIEAGRVVQQGKFDDLALQDGLFARLIARQVI